MCAVSLRYLSLRHGYAVPPPSSEGGKGLSITFTVRGRQVACAYRQCSNYSTPHLMSNVYSLTSRMGEKANCKNNLLSVIKLPLQYNSSFFILHSSFFIFKLPLYNGEKQCNVAATNATTLQFHQKYFLNAVGRMIFRAGKRRISGFRQRPSLPLTPL